MALCSQVTKAITWTTLLGLCEKNTPTFKHIYIHRDMTYSICHAITWYFSPCEVLYLATTPSNLSVWHKPWQPGISITVRVIASWQICQGSWYNQQYGSGAHNFTHKICTPNALDLDLDKLWMFVWSRMMPISLCVVIVILSFLID